MSTKVPNGTRVTIARAVAIAVKLLRAHRFAVIVGMLCIQGALVWTLPLMTALLRGALHIVGVRGINQDTIGEVATSPAVLLVFLGIAVTATVLILTEITLFAVIAHLALDGKRLTFTNVWQQSKATARKAVSRQGLLLIPYLTLLLPVSQVGFSSVLTEHVVVPKFVSGELLKTTWGGIVYGVASAAIVYLILRSVLFPALVCRDDTTIVQALRGSFRMTTWRTLIGFGTVMFTAVLVASLTLALLVGIGAAPVAIWQTHTSAGVMIGVLELVRFFVTGAAAAFLSFFFVAYVRLTHGLPAAGPKPDRSAARTRTAAFTLVALAAFFASPQVVGAVNSATFAAGNSPEIIGHRGYPARAVENSIAGIREAADAGADMVETDIQETRDGGIVVFHDVALSRMTGDSRNIYELTEAEATSLTLRQDGRTADLPTLAEFVSAADEQGVRLLVEVKPHGKEPDGFAGRVVEELNRLDPDKTHMIQSLDRDLIDDIGRIDPDRDTAHVVGFQVGGLPAGSSDSAAVIEDWSYTDRIRTEARRDGRGLYVWTVNDLDLLNDYVARGVDGIITDEVALAETSRQRIGAGPIAFYFARARGFVAIE